MISVRAKLAPLLPAVMLAASGCIYNVQPGPVPDIKPAAARLPLTVGVVDSVEAAPDRTPANASEPFVTALMHTGLFRDVRPTSSGGGFDLVVQLSGKQDRTMKAFFPWFLPFCDPMILGCLPIYSITETFTADMQAQVVGGRVYNEKGEAELKCQGTLGCAPASHGDPLARASAIENGAAKLAADLLKDASFFRDMARSRQAVSDEASRDMREPAAAGPAAQPAAVPASYTAPAAAGGQKPWWQN
ncbi:MAG TPA: hypothetical protein VN915_10010 [Elusimicrobiota bacterium]|nr:hypothetical protein [Elusimicrobiota bacterium]